VQPGLPTVQGTLAHAIGRLTGENVLPQGSGRTDAGVHALAQVAAFPLAAPIPAENLVKALNDLLPASIRILAAEEVEPGFHPRHSAQAKTYRYRLYRGPVCPPFLARYVTHHPFPLDEPAMALAAEKVAGKHDFTSFAAVDSEAHDSKSGQEEETSAVRTIFQSNFERQGEELIYTVRGSGFLQHMVRNLIGTFLLVGKGTLAPEDVPRILAARSRSANPGPTAPPQGLYLVGVEY
jgi:tRNA pseudouridine38-40 synthase